MEIRPPTRLTFAQQVSRKVTFRGQPLAVEVSGRKDRRARGAEVIKNLPRLLARRLRMRFYTPLGVELNAASLVGRTVEEIDAIAAEVDRLSPAEMIDIPEMPGKRIMKDGVTVGLFKQLMKGYKISGHNAEELQAILAKPARQNRTLTFVSLKDAREFARRLKKLTGRKFRIPTEEELEAAMAQLSGNKWIWTKTEYAEYIKSTTSKYYSKNIFVLRHLAYIYYQISPPQHRYINVAFLLVEDK